MDELLDKVWLDNTVRSYLISLTILVAFWLLRRIIARFTALLVSRFFAKAEDMGKRHRFRDLVSEPVERFLTVWIIIIALDRLNYPEALNISIYHITLKTVLDGVATILLIISFIWLVNRIIQYAGELLQERAGETQDRSDDQLVVFFRDFLKAITWIAGLLLILKFAFGYNVSNLLTGLSIVGAALALAFRESLENLIASFIIFFDKPFTTGDLVKVEGLTGTVIKIGLRSPRIRTTDKTYSTVPNKKMVDNIIDNQSLRSERNVLNKMAFANNSNPEKLLEFVSKADAYLTALDNVNDWNVYLSDAGADASVVHVEYFVRIEVPIKDFFKLRQQVNAFLLQLKDELELKLQGGPEIHISTGTAE